MPQGSAPSSVPTLLRDDVPLSQEHIPESIVDSPRELFYRTLATLLRHRTTTYITILIICICVLTSSWCGKEDAEEAKRRRKKKKRKKKNVLLVSTLFYS